MATDALQAPVFSKTLQPTHFGNEALASLTLFIAATKPEEMETVKRRFS
jgi:hypothetical protein